MSLDKGVSLGSTSSQGSGIIGGEGKKDKEEDLVGAAMPGIIDVKTI